MERTISWFAKLRTLRSIKLRRLSKERNDILPPLLMLVTSCFTSRTIYSTALEPILTMVAMVVMPLSLAMGFFIPRITRLDLVLGFLISRITRLDLLTV